MTAWGQAGEWAREIWWAGVQAVRSERLVGNVIACAGGSLRICGEEFDLQHIERIVVVGAGKAGAGMAAAVESALADEAVLAKVAGWVNVPADCVRPLSRIHLHAARPAGVNEPTAEGVAGALHILDLVATLGPRDLCLVLISGGGSALLPAPVEGISLADKQAVTRFLSQAGATIHELNTVRRKLSRIKGGGLARACRAGRLLTLVISDVIGDPLDVIASGPTYAETTTAAAALAVLHKFAAKPSLVPQAIFDLLEHEVAATPSTPTTPSTTVPPSACVVSHHIIGNNAMAVAAAAARGRQLGLAVHELGSQQQGVADDVGRDLAQLCRAIRDDHQPVSPPVCVLSGGEPVVLLPPSTQPRKGGRNQQLVLSALASLSGPQLEADETWRDMALLSGGTDGEDGPTDAAGAIVDSAVVHTARQRGLAPADFLQRCDAYHFFAAADALLKTGPTHTNVMDLRVAVIL